MKINGVEFDIDFTDADVIEKIDIGCKEVNDKAEELRKKEDELSEAEGIRQECKIIKEFFDYVLGEGASEEIFKGKNSLNLCLKAYEDIVEERDKQLNSYQERINKYSPDRIQR